MPEYVDHALIQFKHGTPRQAQDQPYQHTVPTYGDRQQFAVAPDGTELLNKENKHCAASDRNFPVLCRSVDITMLEDLSALWSKQSSPRENTIKKVLLLLNYAASQEEAVVTYHASDMVLARHSNTVYLSEPGAHSRSGGNCFLSNDATMPENNGAVLNIAQIIKTVMTSAAEVEIGAMLINTRESVPRRMTLVKMGHPQQRTPMQTDNFTVHAVVNNNVQPRRTKAMDKRFHWLRCRYAQGQFQYYWKPGTADLGNYWTKHHPGAHHKSMQSTVLTPMKDVTELRKIKLTQPKYQLQKIKISLAEEKDHSKVD